MTIAEIILEEIALDGLDGCTCEALWWHLSHREFPMTIDDSSKEYMWRTAIVKLRDVQFYELEEGRPLWTTRTMEANEFGIEIYEPCPRLAIMPCLPVNEEGVMGSSSTYYSRKNISSQVRDEKYNAIITYEEVMASYGNRLIIVANQDCRERFILLDTQDPEVIRNKLTTELYCNLEHIAKGRSEGVYGSDAFAFLSSSKSLKITHGAMGYYRKKLTNMGVIVKKTALFMKQVHNGMALRHDNICYLSRFYKVSTSKSLMFHQSVEEYLLARTNRREFFTDLIRHLGINRRKAHKFIKARSEYFDLSYMKAEDGASIEDLDSLNLSSADASLNGTQDTIMNIEDDKHISQTIKPETSEKSTAEDKTTPPPAKKFKSSAALKSQLVITLKTTLAEKIAADAAEENQDEDEGDSGLTAQLCSVENPMIVQISKWLDELGPDGASRTMLRDHFGLHSLQARHIMKMMGRSNGFHLFYKENKRQKVERVCLSKFIDHHKVQPIVVLPTLAKVSHSGVDTNTSSPASSRPTTPIIIPSSTPVKSKKKGDGSVRGSHVTSKMLERNQLVVSLTHQNKLLLFQDLYKLILTAEESKYDTSMDRKTLKRICERLHNSNDIKIFKTTLQVETRTRDLFYVCEPSMGLESPLMKASLDQQKTDLTASISSSRHAKKEKDTEQQIKTEVSSATAADSSLSSANVSAANDSKAVAQDTSNRIIIPDYEIDSTLAFNKYGYCAKMKRLELLHKFLSYIIYNYQGSENPVNTSQSTRTDDDNSIYRGLPVYHDSLTWKRFIPPDAIKDPEQPGIAYLMDLGPQLPLCLFLALVKVRYRVPEILQYLDHPIQRLVPVKHLPLAVQTPLLDKRKYVYSLRETVSLLCMMGLASNISPAEGSLTYREMSVIYLHRLAVLVDTTETGFGEEIEEDEKATLTHIYNIKEGDERVEEFWIALRNICIGSAGSVAPKTNQDESNKNERPELLRKALLKPSITPKARSAIMEGEIPGDGLGAGGLDSWFFAHLSRSWASCHEKIVPNAKKPMAPSNRLEGATSLEDRKRFLSESHISIKPSMKPLLRRCAHANSSQPLSDSSYRSSRSGSDNKAATAAAREKEGWKKIESEKRKQSKRDVRRSLIDDKDQEATSNMKTLRSIFNPAEDAALVLCKVGLNILGCKEVARKCVRDFLHTRHPDISYDKSSKACWARMVRLIQWGKKERTLNLYRAVALSDPEIASYQDQEPLIASSTFAPTFHKLMELIVKRCENLSAGVSIDLSTFSDSKALHDKYVMIEINDDKEEMPVSIGHTNQFPLAPAVEVEWPEVNLEADLAKYTLVNFILGFMFTSDKMNRAHQMYKVFEQYPQSITESAIKLLQANKIASLRKESKVKHHSMRKFALTYKYELFAEKMLFIALAVVKKAGEVFTSCLNHPQPIIYEGEVKGELLTMISLHSTEAHSLDFTVPEKVLDTSDLPQSDDDFDDDDDNDDEGNEESNKAKVDKRRERFENCQIRPCSVSTRIDSLKLKEIYKTTKREDRLYAKSLMSSLPFKLEVNESLALLESEEAELWPHISEIYSLIHRAGYKSISEDHLLSTWCSYTESKVQILYNVLDILETREIIIPVGVASRCYVSLPNCRMWSIHSLRDTKGRGTGVTLTEDDRVKLTDMEESTDKTTPHEPDKPSSTFTRVDIIPKPWLTPEGTVNYQLLHHLLVSIASTLNMYQSCTFYLLHKRFAMVYSPAAFLDLLKVLEDLQCVKKFYVTQTSTDSLFSKREEVKVTDLPIHPESVLHYEVQHDAFLRLALFMQHTDLSHNAAAASKNTS